MNEQQVQPLSQTEEAALRERHVEAPWYPYRGRNRAGSQCAVCNRSWPCDAARLIATLAAAQAAYGRSDPDPTGQNSPASTLDAARSDAGKGHEPRLFRHPRLGTAALKESWDPASTPVPDDPDGLDATRTAPLDVERLREAVQEVVHRAKFDYNFEGEYADFLVPADALERLRAAFASAEPPNDKAPTAHRHRLKLVFSDEHGDLWRCSCGEQGFDFAQGKEGFAAHLAALASNEVRATIIRKDGSVEDHEE